MILFRDYTQMNALADKFGEKLVILAFPCNQVLHNAYTSTTNYNCWILDNTLLEKTVRMM